MLNEYEGVGLIIVVPKRVIFMRFAYFHKIR